MNKLEDFFKLLADETRLRVLHLLSYGPLCVCQLTGIMKEPQAKVSRHLSKLRDGKLVKTTRQEQFIEYRLADDHALLMALISILHDYQNDEYWKQDIQNLAFKDVFLNECKHK